MTNTEKEYFEFLEEELPSLEPLYIDTATGVMALEQRIKEVNPDIVFIDGVYLMEDDQNARDDWLRVAHITRDLKKLAKRVNKPIVINTQLDEKKSNTKAAPNLSDIKYSQAIAQHISNKDLSQAIANEAPRTITCKKTLLIFCRRCRE